MFARCANPRKLLRLLLPLALAIPAPFALATLVAAAPAPSCHQTADYLVAARERADAVGSDFLIRKKKSPANVAACKFHESAGDVRFPKTAGDGAFTYLALYKDRLLLDEGTGSVRHFVVVDMKSGKVLLSKTAYQDSRVDGAKAYFFADGPVGSKDKCPDVAADMIGNTKLEPEQVVDLDSLAVAATGRIACRYEE
jgi:hypothetical protein